MKYEAMVIANKIAAEQVKKREKLIKMAKQNPITLKNSLDQDKPVKELDPITEKYFETSFLNQRSWRIAGRFKDPYWRVVIQIDTLEFDIALPGLFKSEEDAIKQAYLIAQTVFKNDNKNTKRSL